MGGSASAASWPSSTGCCAARPTRASSCSTATCRSCRRSATSSRSTPTRSCRWRPARRLVGTLSHPLNRPRFDARLQRVTEGYGVLQPRVSVSVVSANRTMFAQVFSGHVGVDPVHDGRVRRLSGPVSRGQLRRQGHLRRRRVRGARSPGACRRTRCSATTSSRASTRAPGSCTDIDLVDDYPASYLALRRAAAPLGARRLADRALAVAHGPGRERRGRVPNTLPVISRWKILDNLRRSLIPPALRAAARRRLDGPARARRRSGRRSRCWCSRSPPTSRSGARSAAASPGVPLREHLRAERDKIADEPAAGGRSRPSSSRIRAW